MVNSAPFQAVSRDPGLVQRNLDALLELESQCHLQNSRASAGTGLPKITFLQSSIWIVEIQTVEGVEEFRPELIVNVLVCASGLQESQIRIEKPRPAQRILVYRLKWSALIEVHDC